MKKLLIISLILLSSCISNKHANMLNEDTTTTAEEYSTKRIKIIDENMPITLYEIDGHEYISNFHGGIIHSEGCPCKNKK